ncbi:hypothetical protein GCM10009090_13630 [[Pseudomonas] boreopolis]|uniref:Tetratricopeptide repeat protein n=2 Tax=Xanthomonas boreopolis TaxID=86183 RepID=A0A919F7I5_9XANT|nr:hypothetical protein GCM10009090_13630 [[Pseudomonas] boreopolis]
MPPVRPAASFWGSILQPVADGAAQHSGASTNIFQKMRTQEMSQQATHLINKALLLLDRGEFERALECLGQATGEAERAGSAVGLVRALVIQGVVLREQGRAEGANSLLERALAVELDEDQQEMLDYELQRARDLLDARQG